MSVATQQRIEVVPIRSLTFLSENPNVHPPSQIEALARSIKTWGMPLPILVDETNAVLAGNGTLAAATAAGLTEVPVVRAEGWSDEKKREYAVLDNKLRQMSDWDDAVLRSEMQSLVETDFLDSIGFTDEQIDKIIADTSSFAPPEDGARSGITLEVTRFAGEKLRISEQERSALLAKLDAYVLRTGKPDGFVEDLVENPRKNHL